MELASFEKLEEIVDEGQYKEFVWTEEEETPLLVDVQTANCLLVVCHALTKEINKDRFKHLVKRSKEDFIKLVDFCWKMVK